MERYGVRFGDLYARSAIKNITLMPLDYMVVDLEMLLQKLN